MCNSEGASKWEFYIFPAIKVFDLQGKKTTLMNMRTKLIKFIIINSGKIIMIITLFNLVGCCYDSESFQVGIEPVRINM